jgi:hypothetical protein
MNLLTIRLFSLWPEIYELLLKWQTCIYIVLQGITGANIMEHVLVVLSNDIAITLNGLMLGRC